MVAVWSSWKLWLMAQNTVNRRWYTTVGDPVCLTHQVRSYLSSWFDETYQYSVCIFFFWQKLESLEKWQPQLKICLQVVIFLMTDMRSPVNYMLYYWVGCPEVYKKKTWKYTWERKWRNKLKSSVPLCSLLCFLIPGPWPDFSQ